ncbi:MAG: MYXO-CTERM sorting domain-containing protein, partial [Planctomycetota bacterium]|nr:MYXO-CTERM sorting domain-containing protein [Planctomycetota bacterium]
SGPVGPEDFGIPAPEVASQDVNTNIQIFLQFELSPGDSASFVSIFEIVPSPGGLAVLGLAGLAGRRRRRRA